MNKHLKSLINYELKVSIKYQYINDKKLYNKMNK